MSLREHPIIKQLAKDPGVIKTAARILKRGWSEQEQNVEIRKSFKPSATPIGHLSISYDKWPPPSGPIEPIPAQDSPDIRIRRDKLSDGEYVAMLNEIISILQAELKDTKANGADQSGDAVTADEEIEDGQSIEE